MAGNLPLEQLLDRLKKTAETEFDLATPMPSGLYHSPEITRLEQETIFSRSLICIGREDEISKPGEFLVHEIDDVSVLVVRQTDLTLSAYVNACAHRHACLVSNDQVDNSKGFSKKFTCPYHAWTYDLEGKLIRAPFMEMKESFDMKSHQLKKLDFQIWQGFVFVSLAKHETNSLSKSLNTFSQNVLDQFDLPRYKTILRETMTWDANWKNLIENYIESYHVPMAHGQTFAKHGKGLEGYVCGEDDLNYCYHRAAQPEETGPGSAHPDNKRLKGEWRRMMIDFCIFPNLLVTVMPDYLWFVSVQPVGTDQFKAIWGVAVPPENLADISDEKFEDWRNQFRDYIDLANSEDKIIVEALYKGTQSQSLPSGTYHPIERNLWQFSRYLDHHLNRATSD